MNVLLTSVGRRAYMVKYFKEVLGTDGEVYVCNSDDKTVAFRYADKSVISPLIYDDNYIPFLLKYCEDNKINMVVSLFDIDLLMLARNKEKFESIGTKVIVSEPEVISICNDKWNTYQFFIANNLLAPKTFLSKDEIRKAIDRKEISYPIIVKPRFGCGSIAIAIAKDEEELDFYSRKLTKEVMESYLKYESAAEQDILIYQEMIDGQEYGADIINDLDKKQRGIVLRKKLAMRAGETDIAKIVDDEAIRDTAKRLGEALGHIGNLDCDMFVSGDKVYVLELNARFGGGYPFSHEAGCNEVKALVKWCQGEDISDDELKANAGQLGFKELNVV